jgi:hypothetical protein
MKTQNKYSWEPLDEARASKTPIKTLLPDLPDDAVVLFTDLDELMFPPTLAALKYLHLSPMPSSVNYHFVNFGLFAAEFTNRPLHAIGTAHLSPNDVRNPHKNPNTWSFQDGGVHCSWCFNVSLIVNKLDSSPYIDLPRIADNATKSDPAVICAHVLSGTPMFNNELDPKPSEPPQDIAVGHPWRPKRAPIEITSFKWWQEWCRINTGVEF